METVLSTLTALDKLEEVRVLNSEIANLISTKEIAERAFTTATLAADTVQVRKNKLEGAIISLEGNIGELATEVKIFLEECRVMLQSVALIMEDIVHKARELADHIQVLCTQIEELENSKSVLLGSISRENEIISRKREDLDIYHARIVTAAKKHLPGKPIVI